MTRDEWVKSSHCRLGTTRNAPQPPSSPQGEEHICYREEHRRGCDLLPAWRLGIMRETARVLMSSRRSLGSTGGAHHAPVGVKWRQSMQSGLRAMWLQLR